MAAEVPKKVFRVLSLDGGGAKGFYTLGVLKEVEARLGCKICDGFDLIFGTSTGAIIAALLYSSRARRTNQSRMCSNMAMRRTQASK